MQLPNSFKEYNGEEIMSNFDGQINFRTAQAIKTNPLYSGYSGWYFYGYVWWEEGQWHCDVWQYRSYKETFSSSTLEELKNDVCDSYGYD